MLCQTAPFKKAFATNKNASGFTAKPSTTTRPSGDGVIELVPPDGHGFVPSLMRLLVYGLGSDNDVASMRIWAWNRVGSGAAPGTLYVASIIGEFSCTLSAYIGVAGSPILNTERLCDTITLVATVGEATITADTTRQGTVEVYSPANDTPGWVQMPTRCPELLEWDFDQTTNTPTMNCLIQFLR